MARMIPTEPRDFHGSRGEERVYRALRALPDEIIVIHSFRWLHPGNAHKLARHLNAQGEGDFVIFDPSRGVMVVEVKGGDVWCERGEWRQRNRHTGYVAAIFPEQQASDTLYRLRSGVLDSVPEAENLLFCHAIWFPDGAVDRSALPLNYQTSMTFDADDIPNAADAITRAFAYWRSVLPCRGGVNVQIAEKILATLAPTLSIVRSVRQTIDEREEQLVQLTREQARVIDFLDEQLHAAVFGAAGTGKTLLAVEKARRLASPSEPVLFLCFNSALRDHLESSHGQRNVSYLTFHGLARHLFGTEGDLESVERDLIEHLANDEPLPFAHVVIDEAQDFDRDWLEFLRYRFRSGAFYVFYDRNQTIQNEKDATWLNDIPCRLVLTRNCRNTDEIARVAYRVAGLSAVPTLGATGPRPTLHAIAAPGNAMMIVETLLQRACEHYKIAAHDIAILTLETLTPGGAWSAARIAGQPTSDRPRPGHVTATTVRRFKGLEAKLVIVVDVDLARAVDEEWRRRLYVACSRGRQAVHLVTATTEAELKEPLRALAGSDKARANWRSLARHLGIRMGGESIDPFD